jgi:cytochrome c biogenesis factor
MNVDPDQQTLGLHAIVKPMVAWIWGATAVLGVAGIVALLPPRRRAASSEAAAAPALRAPRATTT